MPWTGEWPGERECREFGWWTKPNPAGPGYVPCGPDDPEAEPDLNRLLKETVWDRRQKRFLRKEDLGGARLVLHWLHEGLTPEAKTLGDMIDELQSASDELRKMRDLGVVLSEESDLQHGHAILITTEPSVANEFGFELEREDEAEGEAGRLRFPRIHAPEDSAEVEKPADTSTSSGNRHLIVVPSDDVRTVAVLEWEGVSDGMLREKLTAALTEWMVTTEEGKAAWDESPGWFNMIDLSLWLPAPDDLARLLNKHGIRNLTMEIFSDSEFAEDWEMADELVDKGALPDAKED
jgi:hypothetical protein